MTNKQVPHLLTYPRSGSHYFDDILYDQEKIHFTKSHFLESLFDKDNNKNKPIITIARDPRESITSYLALFDRFAPGQEFVVNEKITEYALMYSFLCDNADLVIDFNDLIKEPEAVVKKVLSLLDIGDDDYGIFDREVVPKHYRFIPSSKSLSKYKHDLLDRFDTELCYFYYNKLLAKKITI